MPLQIRRGTTAQRLTITPLPGELIYDTTTGQIFVGDGATAGGATTTGISLEDARDAMASMLTSGVHSGITFTHNDALNRIDATVTIGGIGPFDGDISGSVFADDSTILVDGTDGGAIRGRIDATAPVNVNHRINSSGSGGIDILGQEFLGGMITTNMSIRMQYPDGIYPQTYEDGFSQRVFLDAFPGPVINLLHARGTSVSPTSLQTSDFLGQIAFLGHNGTDFFPGAFITASVDSTPVASNVPSRIRIATNNGTITANRFEFDSDGSFKTNTITSFSGSVIQSNANIQLNATTDLRFADSDSSNYVAFQAPTTIASNVTWTLPNADGSNGQFLVTNGTGTLSFTSNLSASAIVSNNYIQTQSYIDEAGRNSSIPSPSKGMIVFVDNSDDGVPALTVNTDGTLPGWQNLVTFDTLLSGIPSTLERDIKGSVFVDGSTRVIDGETGNITGSAITSTNFVQFPVYADVATRNSAIPNPNPGMVTFVSDNGSAQPRLQVNTDGTNGGWVDLH